MSIVNPDSAANDFTRDPFSEEKDPHRDLVEAELLKALQGNESLVVEGLPQHIESTSAAVRPQISDTLDITPEHLEIAKRLQVRSVDLNNTPNLLEQIGALYDKCLVPPEIIRQVLAGNYDALCEHCRHGMVTDKFDPSPEELEIYSQHQAAYMSPKEHYKRSLEGNIGREGEFKMMALIDSAKPDGENIVGFLAYRTPDGTEAYKGYMWEVFNLDGKPGQEKGDTNYVSWWKTENFAEQVEKIWELEMIVVERGYRKCGGPLILLDAVCKDIREKFRNPVVPKEAKRVFCNVFEGFILEDSEDDDVGQSTATGKNLGSDNFFRNRGFSQFATRHTANEVAVYDTGENGQHEYHALPIAWSYLYSSMKQLEDNLEKSPILKALQKR